MGVSAQEDAAVAVQPLSQRPAIDTVKLIIWIGGGILPWAAIYGAVRLMMAVLG